MSVGTRDLAHSILVGMPICAPDVVPQITQRIPFMHKTSLSEPVPAKSIPSSASTQSVQSQCITKTAFPNNKVPSNNIGKIDLPSTHLNRSYHPKGQPQQSEPDPDFPNPISPIKNRYSLTSKFRDISIQKSIPDSIHSNAQIQSKNSLQHS